MCGCLRNEASIDHFQFQNRLKYRDKKQNSLISSGKNRDRIGTCDFLTEKSEHLPTLQKKITTPTELSDSDFQVGNIHVHAQPIEKQTYTEGNEEVIS